MKIQDGDYLMTDDIVTLLRKEYDHFNNDGVGDYEVIITAADEIERLRAQNLEWRDLIDQTQAKAFAEIERLRAEIKELQEANEYLRSRVPLFVREEEA